MSLSSKQALELAQVADKFGGGEATFIGHAMSALRAGRELGVVVELLGAMARTPFAERRDQQQALKNVRWWLKKRADSGATASEVAFELGWLKRFAVVRAKAGTDEAKQGQPPKLPIQKPQQKRRPVELRTGERVVVEILDERTKKGGLRLREVSSGLTGVVHPMSRPIDDPTPGRKVEVIVASSGRNPQFRVAD